MTELSPHWYFEQPESVEHAATLMAGVEPTAKRRAAWCRGEVCAHARPFYVWLKDELETSRGSKDLPPTRDAIRQIVDRSPGAAGRVEWPAYPDDADVTMVCKRILEFTSGDTAYTAADLARALSEIDSSKMDAPFWSFQLTDEEQLLFRRCARVIAYLGDKNLGVFDKPHSLSPQSGPTVRIGRLRRVADRLVATSASRTGADGHGIEADLADASDAELASLISSISSAVMRRSDAPPFELVAAMRIYARWLRQAQPFADPHRLPDATKTDAAIREIELELRREAEGSEKSWSGRAVERIRRLASPASRATREKHGEN